MDHNVRREITDGLRLCGVDVMTAFEDGMATAPDEDILDRATTLGRVVFTGDQDFLQEAARRQRAGESFAGIVYARPRRVSIGRCISDLEVIAKLSDPDDLAGRVTYLPM
jgi:hypothetical protein